MLNRLALRLATVRALSGATVCGKNVLDSDRGAIDEIAAHGAIDEIAAHGAIDEIAADKPRPFIVVFTDDGQFRHSDRDLWTTSGDNRHGSGFQKLIIEYGMTQRAEMVDDAGNKFAGAVDIVTDAAMEFNVDMIERQIMSALMDPGNLWAQVWRDFVISIGDRDSQRGVSGRDGVRFAGRQITLSIELAKEPVPGVAVGPRWQRFLDLAATDPELANILPVITASLAGGPPTDWQRLQMAYGLTKDEAGSLQMIPPAGAQDIDPLIAVVPAGQPDAQDVTP